MRIVITAGPTWERIDAVRYIGNRSSGKLGLALAQHAAEANHKVTLLLGPHVPEPVWPRGYGDQSVARFESTLDLERLLERQFDDHDVLVMAAAVADFRPIQSIVGKWPRQDPNDVDGDSDSAKQWMLSLIPTPDLVARLARHKHKHQKIIAFALESAESLRERAKQKLVLKAVDAIVANPLDTMGGNHIEPLWLPAHGPSEVPGRMTKFDFAKWLLSRIEKMQFT